MQLFPNVDNGEFQESVAVSREVTQLGMKRGDSNTAYLTPVRANAVFTIPGTVSDLYFAVKADFNEASPALLLANDWTLSSGVWSSPITQDIEEIETLLDGAEYKDVYAEVTWTSSTTGIFSSKTIRFRIYNDVWKGGEPGPIVYPPGFSTPLALTSVPVNDPALVQTISATAIDWKLAKYFKKADDTASTFTFSNVAIGKTIEIYMNIASGTAYDPTWPAGITWATTAPAHSGTTPFKVTLTCTGAGTYDGSWTDTAITIPSGYLTGNAATSQGQSAFVEHGDGSFTEWAAVVAINEGTGAIDSTEWIPRTGGIVKNTDTNGWWRVAIASSAVDLQPLTDQ